MLTHIANSSKLTVGLSVITHWCAHGDIPKGHTHRETIEEK